jgi:hypothetical protein
MNAMADLVGVVRGDFAIEDPWLAPSNADLVRLRRATDGAAPRLATTVAAYFDDHFLTFVFSGCDDHIEATYFTDGDPLYEEDVVEVFLAPEEPSRYFEIEVNPHAAIFDARIDSPGGTRATMAVDRAWRSQAVAAVRRLTEAGGLMTVDTLLRIPFASLGRPAPGERWRANLFRIDRHPLHGDEYSAWRPTLRDPADFHVTAAFGWLEFRP